MALNVLIQMEKFYLVTIFVTNKKPLMKTQSKVFLTLILVTEKTSNEQHNENVQ